MDIRHGLSPAHIPEAAHLYWQAFGAKLGRVLGPPDKALAFLHRVLDSDHALSAVDHDGALLGVVGFKTSQGALVGGSFADLRAIYGTFGAAWRAALLHLLERDIENRRFVMDGLFVAPQARGRGVGTALLDAISAEAARRGYDSVRLDVIDSNPRARALYERRGFTPLQTNHMGPLRHIFGFAAATAMERPVLPGSVPRLR